MLKQRTDPSPMTEAEARRRLGAAYAILLDLAARRRAQEAQAADQTTDTIPTEASDRYDDRPATI